MVAHWILGRFFECMIGEGHGICVYKEGAFICLDIARVIFWGASSCRSVIGFDLNTSDRWNAVLRLDHICCDVRTGLVAGDR